MITEYKFSVEEIRALSHKMILLVDSREKKNEHILAYCRKHRIAVEGDTLPYGDYSFYLPAGASSKLETPLYFHREIVVERKASLEELSGNLGKERKRFEQELNKAMRDHCRMHLLIEHPPGYRDIIEHHYQTEFDPVAYMASLSSFESRYGLHVKFVDPAYMGYLIYSTFYYFLRERLY